MKFKIPFTISNVDVLKRKAKVFVGFFRTKIFKSLDSDLKNCDVDIDSGEYMAICFRTFLINFFTFLFLFLIAGFFIIDLFYIFAAALSLLFSSFIFFVQSNYPKLYSIRKARNIEKNLIPAMQDMLVQLSSGIPMFNILSNIANGDYGEVSEEFKKAVREINTGEPQIEAIEELGKENISVFFRRVLWQISNGMKAGSDMSVVIRDGIDNLNKEQMLQIQNYGARINPLIMFYMLLAVIIPSLGLTFLTIVSSMVNISKFMIIISFIGMFIFVTIMQILFIGMLRVRRPSLI